MEFTSVSHDSGVATVTLSRGKVNAIHEQMVAELDDTFASLARDDDTRAIVLTGNGKFFSFGFDVPHFYDYSPDEFTGFLRAFCNLSLKLFLFPKPVVAAVNGHCTAGGCILALACDRRIMVDEGAKIGLNEVTFGSSIFASSVAMLAHTVGARRAEQVLLTGKLFSPKEAFDLGLADKLAAADSVLTSATKAAAKLGMLPTQAYGSLKRLLRQPVADSCSVREDQSIREFVQIWYSPATREMTKGIQIRS